MAGMVYAFVTANVVRAGEDSGDELEVECGWVDPRWSRTELFDNRNDVSPVVKEYEDDEELYDHIQDALADILGAYGDNGNGTLYASDSTQEINGDSWCYSMHFTIKSYGPKGWTEKAWVPDHDKL